tara:strand:- start:374 stop:595 length:222 start_codon:yes stop_codon:yes gene_type:complete
MKINLVKIIKSKYPNIRKKINKETDLMEDMVFDSLELMGFLTFIEKKYNFQTKKYLKKNNKFQIKLIENFLKK